MRHDIRISAFVPFYHRHLDSMTISNTYLPRLQWSFSNLNVRGSAQWHDRGAISMALTYEADLNSQQDHHQAWLNAALTAAQQASLQVAEAYITRSIGMGLLGGGAGAAGGYRVSGNAFGAAVLGMIGLAVGSLVRAEIPIYQAQYSPAYGWTLVAVQQSVPQNFQFRLA
jgi:hypothetical protein